MNRDDVIARLKKKQNGRSLSQFAKDIGITKSFLSDVYLGKRGMGNKILLYLNLVANDTTYREVKRQ